MIKTITLQKSHTSKTDKYVHVENPNIDAIVKVIGATWTVLNWQIGIVNYKKHAIRVGAF